MKWHLAAGLAGLAALSCGAAIAQPPPAPTRPPSVGIPDYAAVKEGQPIDSRPPEIIGGKPQFPEQTRAPYHKTAAFKVTEITSVLYAPWALAFLPDGKFLVTEKLPGTLVVVDQTGHISRAVTGLEKLGVTWPETGLLDLALDPNYATNHRIFFTFFAFDRAMIGGIQLARATFNEAANSLSDIQVIFRAIPATPNDNRSGVGSRSGGRIAIGPDGFLYMTVGDRDGGGAFPWRVAQTLDTHLGKILRLTLDGKPAPGNPFTGQEGALPEIWAIGQRSQEGLAFDPSGKLWEVEHGPRGGDELNLIEKGKNYGWPIISHGIDYPGPPMGDAKVAQAGMEQPVYYWSPSTAPSGLAFYQGTLFPEWKNSLFVGMLRGNSLERLGMANGKIVNEEPLLTDVKMRIRDVRVGPDGAVYVLTDSGGGSITDDTPPGSKLLKLTPK
jgi:glucose/arabinose dehydrogenase